MVIRKKKMFYSRILKAQTSVRERDFNSRALVIRKGKETAECNFRRKTWRICRNRFFFSVCARLKPRVKRTFNIYVLAILLYWVNFMLILIILCIFNSPLQIYFPCKTIFSILSDILSAMEVLIELKNAFMYKWVVHCSWSASGPVFGLHDDFLYADQVQILQRGLFFDSI